MQKKLGHSGVPLGPREPTNSLAECSYVGMETTENMRSFTELHLCRAVDSGPLYRLLDGRRAELRLTASDDVFRTSGISEH